MDSDPVWLKRSKEQVSEEFLRRKSELQLDVIRYLDDILSLWDQAAAVTDYYRKKKRRRGVSPRA